MLSCVENILLTTYSGFDIDYVIRSYNTSDQNKITKLK